MHDLRVEDVAHEAGVSPALIYYYFKTKDRLLSQAFEFADARSFAYSHEELQSAPSGRERVAFVLTNEIGSDDARRENWVIWSETSAAAVFDPVLRESVERWGANWQEIVADLIRDGQSEGTIPADVEPWEAADRLTAVVDSVGTRWMMGSMTEADAHRSIGRAVDRELG